MAPLSLEIIPMASWCVLFPMFLVLLNSDMLRGNGGIFSKMCWFLDYSGDRTCTNFHVSLFLLRTWNCYQRNFNPYPNHSNIFNLIFIFLASYIHVLSWTPVWDKIFGLVTNPTFTKYISKSINNKEIKLLPNFYKYIISFET